MDVSIKDLTFKPSVTGEVRRPHPVNGEKLASGYSSGRSNDTHRAALVYLSVVSYALSFLPISSSSE